MWVGLFFSIFSFAHDPVFTFSTGEQLVVTELEDATFVELRGSSGKVLVRFVDTPLVLPVSSRASQVSLHLGRHSVTEYELPEAHPFAILTLSRIGTILLRNDGSFLRLSPPSSAELKVIPFSFRKQPAMFVEKNGSFFLLGSAGVLKKLGKVSPAQIRRMVATHDPASLSTFDSERLRDEASGILDDLIRDNVTKTIEEVWRLRREGFAPTAGDQDAADASRTPESEERGAFQLSIATFNSQQLRKLVEELRSLQGEGRSDMTAVLSAFGHAKACDRSLTGAKNPLRRAS